MVEVFNPNPVIFKPAKSEKKQSGSLWIDDGYSGPGVDELSEPIDQDEVYGTFDSRTASIKADAPNRASKDDIRSRTSKHARRTQRRISTADTDIPESYPRRIHTHSTSLRRFYINRYAPAHL